MRRLFIAVFFFFALTVAVIAGAVRGTLLNDDEPLAVSAQAQPKDSLGWAHLKSGQFITSSYQKATMVAFYLDEANSTDDRETKSSSYALITYESAVSRTGQAFVIHEAMPDGRIFKIYLKGTQQQTYYLIPTTDIYYLSPEEIVQQLPPATLH